VLSQACLLEQVKEKERVIDEMYQEDCKKLAKAQEKLEEKILCCTGNTDCITTFTSSIHTHFQIQKHFFFQLFL
jgi:hypothetical protein